MEIHLLNTVWAIYPFRTKQSNVEDIIEATEDEAIKDTFRTVWSFRKNGWWGMQTHLYTVGYESLADGAMGIRSQRC